MSFAEHLSDRTDAERAVTLADLADHPLCAR
jgi:hypothetical protein